MKFNLLFCIVCIWFLFVFFCLWANRCEQKKETPKTEIIFTFSTIFLTNTCFPVICIRGWGRNSNKLWQNIFEWVHQPENAHKFSASGQILSKWYSIDTSYLNAILIQLNLNWWGASIEFFKCSHACLVNSFDWFTNYRESIILSNTRSKHYPFQWYVIFGW